MIRNSVLVLVLFALAACGNKEVKQPSAESTLSLEAFAVAEAVRGAFEKNDITKIRNNTTDQGYRAILQNKRPFEAVELQFTPRWVEIEGTQVVLNVTWKSTWTSGGKASSDRGMAVFYLEGRPLKIAKIQRANPFLFPEH